ncbi:MAG TPA: hypothetical protein VFF06_31815, partial [Polyangia bacterium]|nr:hypothetical protein [Polyangia bacterium]
YENWFIETCDEWVVPYIGDLLAVRARFPVDPNAMSLRPFVANTLDYRRKKGTAAMLEGLARDVTNWPARAVEFFQLLPVTENLNHVRPSAFRTPDLRDTDALERLNWANGAFETTGHFADVRRIATQGGKYNLPNVGLFLWRLEAFVADVVDPRTQKEVRVPAVPDGAAPTARWRFDPLGRDSVLFNPSRTVEGRRVLESDVPGPLRLRAVYDELEAARAAWTAHGEISYAYLASSDPALGVHVIGEAKPLDPLEIQICDLSQWTTALPPSHTFTRSKSGGGTETLVTRVAIDPRLGRLAFIDNTSPRAVHVRYAYGFSADLGGGFYSRRGALTDPGTRTPFNVSVNDQNAATDNALKTALAAWVTAGRPNALIEIQDGGFYDVSDIDLPASTTLEIRARDTVRAVLKLKAPWKLSLGAESHLRLDGLLVSGAALQVKTSDAPDELDHDLTLSHVTLEPATSGVTLAAASVGRLTLTAQKSILGPLALGGAAPDSSRVVVIADSIVQSIDQSTDAQLDRVTIFGAVETRTVEASDCIFAGGLDVERTQQGCVRFSFLPDGSRAPRAYRCQPAQAIHDAGADHDPAAAALIKTRLVPMFTSLTYGDPGYAQLALDGPDELAAGASNGSEMGAFQFLLAPQRRANLLTALDEYLRFGLEAGFFFPT